LIVDTSALIAIVALEEGHERLRAALVTEDNLIPAPVLAEFHLVTSSDGNAPNAHAQAFLATILRQRSSIESFSAEDALLVPLAHQRHGRGNGSGGKLNLLDIMVYCMARRLERPILCAGRDFVPTGIMIHKSSRIQ
jgi:ribonuclease VapC